MSAAIAPHREAVPISVRTTKRALIPREKATFARMVASVRREWWTSQGRRERSSDMRAMSAVSIAASLPAAPIAIPKEAHAIADHRNLFVAIGQPLDQRNLVFGQEPRVDFVDTGPLGDRVGGGLVVARQHYERRDALGTQCFQSGWIFLSQAVGK